MAAKILVVDDEPKILKAVEHSLINAGFRVIKAMDGESALRLAEAELPDLVVLDLMLPGLDGFEVCRRLRQRSDVPVLVLSARGAETDKVVGFHLGIDDYLTKPFSPAELVLRVKAILRRAAGPAPARREEVELGSLSVNHSTRQAFVRGRPVELTAKEFELLWLLANHPGQVFSREQLLNQIWETDYYGDTNAVTMLVRRLREKLEEDPSRPRLIRTVWGVGYKLEADPAAE